MRFNRYLSRPNESREWTPRREAAARRAVKRERDDVPLFPELARYKTVEERKAEIDNRSEQFIEHMRMFNAKAWRRARRYIGAMQPNIRRGFIRYWNENTCPADPVYLLDAIAYHHRTGYSPWSWLRERHQLRLIGAGKLARIHLNETFSRFARLGSGRFDGAPPLPRSPGHPRLP